MLRVASLLIALSVIATVAGLLLSRTNQARADNTIVTADSTGPVGVGIFNSLVLDAAGNPVVSYYNNNFAHLRVLHCGTPACDAGNTIVDADIFPQVGTWTSIALDPVGNPVVSYYNSTDGDLRILHCGDPSCTSGNSITSPDTNGDVGTHTDLVLDAAGNPVVSYYDNTYADLKLLHCGDATCSSGNTIVSPDTAGTVGRNSSLALDGAGRPVVSYVDESTNDLKVLRCGDASCSAGNTITAPDTAGNLGDDTSLELDAFDNPVVAYTDLTNVDLKVLFCGDAACTSGNTVVSLDTAGDVGYDSSLELDGAGNPVVAYFDNTSFDLKVLHCGNADCTAGNTVSVPDSLANVGTMPSLALDAVGHPVVSYRYLSDNDLRVLHCSSPSCSVAPDDTATPTPTGTPQSAPAVFAIDAIPFGTIDAARTVTVGQTFSIDAVLESYSGPTWYGYQVVFDYHDEVLDGVGTGTNVVPFPPGFCIRIFICVRPFCNLPTPTSDDDADGATWSANCIAAGFDGPPGIQSGRLVRFTFLCEAPGVATIRLRDSQTFVSASDDLEREANITCIDAPTGTPEATETPLPTSTPLVPAPSVLKIPHGNENNVGMSSTLLLANLFLCEDPDASDEPDGLCDGDNEGKLVFTERAFSPSPLGAFEFQIKFDHKIFDIDLECVTQADPGPDCTALDTESWDIELADDLLADPFREWSIERCFRNVTENYINFACVSTGPPGAGLTGEIELAHVTLHPDADLKFRLTPGNDNGVVRVILDENCELVDPLGHPVAGSVAGGLTPVCGDLAVTVRILEGDVDLDCDVDLGDAQAIAQLYGMVFGLFLYDPWYDLEPNITDFDIDAKDLQKVFGRLGSTCQDPIPPQPPVSPPQN